MVFVKDVTLNFCLHLIIWQTEEMATFFLHFNTFLYMFEMCQPDLETRFL